MELSQFNRPPLAAIISQQGEGLRMQVSFHSPIIPVHILGLYSLKSIPKNSANCMPLHILFLCFHSKVQVIMNVIDFVTKGHSGLPRVYLPPPRGPSG